MAFKFPFSNLHELGLDWILEQVKTFSELIPEMETSSEDIQHAQETADNANLAATAAQETADEAIELISQIPGATPSDEIPVIDGTPYPGVSVKYSRGDHKHPTDISRASQADLDTLQQQVNTLPIPTASTDSPLMDGTASAGASTEYSRKDHVHPTDTSRASQTDLAALSARVDNISGSTTPSTSNPMMDGVASPGSSANYSRGDHVHPTDTSRASVSSLQTLQNQVNDLNIPEPSNDSPLMDGNASAGLSAKYSRKDHVHPSDTNRAGIKTIAYSDIDNVQETAFYTTTGTVASLYHITWDSNYSFQMGHFYGESDVRYRIKSGGNWSSWFVLGSGGGGGGASPSTSNPIMDGTASPGTSANYSRGDHVHPTDTSRASQTDLAALSARVDNIHGGAVYLQNVPCYTGTGDFVQYSNASIKSTHVVAAITFANPAAIKSDYTWTTANGSITVNGTCSVSTTANIILVEQ